MKQWIALVTVSVLLVAAAAMATDYRYVKQDTFKGWLESGRPMVIVDIQPAEDFAEEHFKGAIETNAYPVKSDEEKKRLDVTREKIGASTEDVIIVCPRGGAGAKNTYDYLKSKGVEEKRLHILEKGSKGWPWPELCVDGR